MPPTLTLPRGNDIGAQLVFTGGEPKGNRTLRKGRLGRRRPLAMRLRAWAPAGRGDRGGRGYHGTTKNDEIYLDSRYGDC